MVWVLAILPAVGSTYSTHVHFRGTITKSLPEPTGLVLKICFIINLILFINLFINVFINNNVFQKLNNTL